MLRTARCSVGAAQPRPGGEAAIAPSLRPDIASAFLPARRDYFLPPASGFDAEIPWLPAMPLPAEIAPAWISTVSMPM